MIPLAVAVLCLAAAFIVRDRKKTTDTGPDGGGFRCDCQRKNRDERKWGPP